MVRTRVTTKAIPASLYAPDEIDRAVKSGVEYLVNAQRENGSIADRGHEVAMTALAIMAMASIGVEPQDLLNGRTLNGQGP